MTSILLLCADDLIERELARALVMPVPDAVITTVNNVRAALDRIHHRTYDAVLIHRPTNELDSGLLLLAAIRSNPNRTVVSVTGGGPNDSVRFQMIVRTRSAAFGPDPLPMNEVAMMLASLRDEPSLLLEGVC